MEADEAFSVVIDRVRHGLQRLAAENGGQFVDASAEPRPQSAPGIVYRLIPVVEGAAWIEIMPDTAYSTYISVGEGGWIEVFTSPKDPESGAEDVMKIAAGAVAGRLRERVWTRRRTGEYVDSLLYIQYEPDERWRLIGEVGRPLPLLRRWLYNESVTEYRPYRA